MVEEQNQERIPEKINQIWQQLEKSPPGWLDFSVRTKVSSGFVKALPVLIRRLFLRDDELGLSEEQLPALPRTIAEIEDKISQAKSNPQFTKALFLQRTEESDSWQKIQKAKAFFRPPKENQAIVQQIDQLSEDTPFWTAPLKDQQKIIKETNLSFSYQLAWLGEKFFSPPNPQMETVSAPRIIPLKLVRQGKEKVFQGITQASSWATRKIAGLVGKKVISSGAKATVSAAGKGVLATVGSALGISGGPPGWVATAAVLGLGIIKKGVGKFFSGLTGFLNNLGPATTEAEQKSDKDLWLMIICVLGGLPILLMVLVLFGAGILGSSLFVSHHESGAAFEGILDQTKVDFVEVGRDIVNDYARRAREIELVINQCFGTTGIGSDVPYVNSTSFYNHKDCLAKNLDSGAFNAIKFSVDNFTYLQCVGFVKAVVPGLRGVSANAAGFADPSLVIPGFTRLESATTEPQQGDIIVTTQGGRGNGHIAVVSNVRYPNEAGGLTYVEITHANSGSATDEITALRGAVFTSSITLDDMRDRFTIIWRQ